MAVSDPVVIGHEQNKFIKDSTSKALGLFRPNYAGAGSYWSGRHIDDTTAYQVPADKKFIILQMNWTCFGSDGQILLYVHNVADSSGGTEIWRGSGISGDFGQCSTPYYYEVATGNYLNMKSDATNLNWNIFGVEVDA